MSLKPLVPALVLTAAVPLLAQDWKGTGRLEGRVLGPDGAPLADVSVRLELPGRGTTTIKTDHKGRWAIAGLASGPWNIDFEAPGFAPKKITVRLQTEAQRLPPVEVRLDRGSKASSEALAIVTAADEAYKAGRYAEARVEYEKLLSARPDLAASLHRQIARCYSQEHNYAKELEHLQPLLDAEPQNVAIRLLMAQEALKGGMLDRGMQLLSATDESNIKDPNVFYNIAVLLLNQQKPEEAISYLTKAIAVDPSYVDGYFQRGLTYLQLQKVPESLADFRKVLEIAPPGSPQAETAKKALDQLK